MQAWYKQSFKKSLRPQEVVVKGMAEATDFAEGVARRNAACNVGSKAGRPHLKQPTFNWLAKDI